MAKGRGEKMSDENRNTGQSIDATSSFKWIYRVAALLSMAVLPIFVPASQAADNCEDLITSRPYQCDVKDDDGLTFSDCFRFTSTSPGGSSENFDLSLDMFPGLLGCDCQADGSFSDPEMEFGNTDSFHCVSTVLSESSLFGLALYGDVKRNGGRITGQAIDEGGDSYVFRCNQVGTCEVPMSTAGAPSAGW
jgi:hypothetical protein